jgi:hypothetical protein
MAIKTFTTGEVLTASDTNTYLANSGLVYIKQQTVGTTVASVTVSSAFSTDYDNYRILIDVTTLSNPGTSIGMSLNNASGSTYLHGGIYMLFGSTTVNGYGPAATTSWTDLMAGGSPSCASVEIHNPFATRPTTAMAQSIRGNTSPSYGHYVMNALETSSNSHTAFTITTITGTMTGGTIYVYGYRKA